MDSEDTGWRFAMRWPGEQIDGPSGVMWVRRSEAIQWRDRALAAEMERTDLRAEVEDLRADLRHERRTGRRQNACPAEAYPVEEAMWRFRPRWAKPNA